MAIFIKLKSPEPPPPKKIQNKSYVHPRIQLVILFYIYFQVGEHGRVHAIKN